MRILFVLPYLPSPIRVRPYNFLRELGRRHQVTVLATGSEGDHFSAEELDGLCEAIHGVPLRRPTALMSCARAALRGEPLQAAYCRSASFHQSLRQLLAVGDFDIVHVEHLRAAHAIDSIPARMPTLFDSVDCISLLLRRTLGSSHSLPQRLIAALELSRSRRYEARILGRFDRVAVTSPEDGRELQSLAPGAEISVVPNGVDLEYFRPLEGPREPATLVFSGKMSYHANVTAVRHFVRDIFPFIKVRHPEVRLRVAGSNPPAVVRALAGDPAISVTGYLPDLRTAVGRATVAICPVTVQVGIQNKVLEAMAMGLPVVSTREGARALQAEAGGDLLVAGSAEEFALQVCRLLEEPELRSRVGAAARKYVETHHRWSDAAGRLEELYGRAVESHRAHGPITVRSSLLAAGAAG